MTNMAAPIEGKVALVTGSSAGIGKTIALRLAEAGATVMVNARTEQRARPVAEEIRARGGTADFQVADLLDRFQIEKMVDATVQQFGRLDIVIANGAGATKITLPWQFFHEMDPERFMPIAVSHWLSKAYLIRAALPHIIPLGYGKIVNISTDAGRAATVGESLIGGGAAGLQQMTRVIAREVGRYGIRVNTISCGPISDNPPGEIEGYNEMARQQTEAGSKVSPRLNSRRIFPVAMADLAETVLFLVDKSGDNITGQTWSVNGGLTMPQ